MSTSSPIASSSRLPPHAPLTPLSTQQNAIASSSQSTPKTPRTVPSAKSPTSCSSKGKERAQDALDGRLPLPSSPASITLKPKRVRRPHGPSKLAVDVLLGEAGPSTLRTVVGGDDPDLHQPDLPEGQSQWEVQKLVEEEGKDVVPTVFSADGRYFFKAIGSRIHIHSTTGPHHSLVTTLPSTTYDIPCDRSTGHTLPITSLFPHPTNPLQLISSSLDGTIILWNWTSSPSTALVRQIDAGFNHEFLSGGKAGRMDLLERRRAMSASERRAMTGYGRGVGKMVLGKEGGRVFVYASLIPRKVPKGEHKLHKHLVVRIPLRQVALPPPDITSPITPPKQYLRIARANIEVLGSISTPISTISVSPRGTYLLVTSNKDAYVRRLDVPVVASAKQQDEISSGTMQTAPVQAWLRVSSNTSITTSAWCSVDGLCLPEFMRNRDEEWFATGEHKGLIKLWYGLAEAFAAENPSSMHGAPSAEGDAMGADLQKLSAVVLISTVLHWHSHAVSALHFHPTGTQLLSGGEENVLVSWQLEKLKESFVPRLGSGGIATIGIKPTGPTGAEEEIWVRLRDGTTKKVGAATGLTSHVGKEVRLDQVNKVDPKLSYPLAYHVPTGSYVLPSSHPSVIQFYQPSTSSVLFELEVTPSNRISRSSKAAIEPLRVESVCFSPVGESGIAHWMATSESREGDADEGGGRAKALKLWEWQKDGYILNTHLAKAHGLNNITSISFGPLTSKSAKSDATLLSTSEDGIAKLWHIRKALSDTPDPKDPKKVVTSHTLFWSVRSTFSHRVLPIISSAFSPDASLLALAHGSLVTLWDSGTNVMLKVLESGAGSANDIAFVGGAEGGRWLAAVGQGKGVAVWDLMAGELAWTLPALPVQSLLSSPSSSSFLVLSPRSASGQSASTSISTFDPSSPVPKVSGHVSQQLVCPILLYAGGTTELLALTSKGVPVRAGNDSRAYAKPVKSLKEEEEEIFSGEIAGMSIWEEMFGKGVFGAAAARELVADESEDEAMDETEEMKAKPDELSASHPEKRGKYSLAFDGPSHTLPPTSILFDSFLDDFLKPDREAVAVEDRRRLRAEDKSAGTEMEYDEDKMDVKDQEDVKDVKKGDAQARHVPEVEVRQLGEWFKELLGTQMCIPAATPPTASADQSMSSTPSKVKPAKKAYKVVASAAPAAGSIAGDVDGTEESATVGQKRKNVGA